MPDSDTFIETLAEIYRKPQIVDDNEVDDSVELLIVSAASSLEIVHSFLQQQEDSKELFKHVNVLDHYISLKSMSVMKQTTIYEFFNQQQ